MVAEGLARVHVAQVHLGERNLHREQGVAQGDARVREAGGVEDDEGHVPGRGLVDELDQLRLRVALVGGEVVAGLGGQLAHPFVDLVERDLAVQARLAQAEQVQVRTIQQQDVRHERNRPPEIRRNFTANGS